MRPLPFSPGPGVGQQLPLLVAENSLLAPKACSFELVDSSPLAQNNLLAPRARAHAQIGSCRRLDRIYLYLTYAGKSGILTYLPYIPRYLPCIPLPAVLPLTYEDLVAIVVGKLLAQTADAELVGHVRITHTARRDRNNFARTSNFH